MIINPFDTIPCLHYVIQPTVKALRETRLTSQDQIFPVNSPVDGKPMPGVYGLVHGDSGIKPFAHPIVVMRPSRDRPGYPEADGIYLDLRACTTPLGEGMGYRIGGSIEHQMWAWRAILIHKSMRSDTPGSDILGLGIWPMTIYMRWISQALTRRLALPPEVQMRVAILVGYFYFCMALDTQVMSSDPLSERDLLRASTLISRAGNFSVNDIVSVIGDLPRANNTEDLVNLLVNHTQSLRFEADRFNLPVLYAAIEGSWLRGIPGEVVRVAMEHLPTWMTLVLLATKERGVNKTGIGDIAQQLMRSQSDESKHFTTRLYDLATGSW